MNVRMPAKSDDLLTAARHFQRDGGGIGVLHVVDPRQLPAMAAEALLQGGEAMALFQTVADGARLVQKTKDRPLLCATCPRHLRAVPHFLIVVLPDCPAPRRGLAAGVCRRCAPDLDTAMQAGRQHFQGMFPDLRPLTVHLVAGTA